MKYVYLAIIVFFLTSCDTVVKKGNTDKKPLSFDFAKTRDADCGMIVDGLKFSSQVIAPDGRTWFFHDPGGVPRFLKDKSFRSEAVIWFYTLDTKRWKTSHHVSFSLRDETPMGYGFGAYEKKKDGFISYEQMRTKMLRGENLLNPYVKKKLLEHR